MLHEWQEGSTLSLFHSDLKWLHFAVKHAGYFPAWHHSSAPSKQPLVHRPRQTELPHMNFRWLQVSTASDEIPLALLARASQIKKQYGGTCRFLLGPSGTLFHSCCTVASIVRSGCVVPFQISFKLIFFLSPDSSCCRDFSFICQIQILYSVRVGCLYLTVDLLLCTKIKKYIKL